MPRKPKPSLLHDARASGRYLSRPEEIVDGDTSTFTGIYGLGKIDAKRKKKGTYNRRDMRAKD